MILESFKEEPEKYTRILVCRSCNKRFQESITKFAVYAYNRGQKRFKND